MRKEKLSCAPVSPASNSALPSLSSNATPAMVTEATAPMDSSASVSPISRVNGSLTPVWSVEGLTSLPMPLLPRLVVRHTPGMTYSTR